MNIKEGVSRIWTLLRGLVAIGWILGLAAIVSLSYSGRETLQVGAFPLWLSSYAVAGMLLVFALTGTKSLFARFSATLLAVYPFVAAIPESMSVSGSEMVPRFLQVFFSWGLLALILIAVIWAVRWIAQGFNESA